MKQFQLIYEKEYALTAWIQRIDSFCKQHEVSERSMLFRFFSDIIDQEGLEALLGKILERFPGAHYAGSTTTANIVYGSLGDGHIAITCTIFEDPETEIRILQLPVNARVQDASLDTVLHIVEDCSWVKAIEIMSTLNDTDMDRFCRKLSCLPEKIEIYGGCANTGESSYGLLGGSFVFSEAGRMQNQSAVFILMGGPSLYINTGCLTGWQKIGRPLPVTDSKNNQLISLCGKPAGEVYENALGIRPGKDFYKLTNVFPLQFNSDDVPYLRIVTGRREDGSLSLSAYIKNEEKCAFTYGDTEHILDHLEENLKTVQEFEPQTIQLFSCEARLVFWGDEDAGIETLPFESIAPVSGYYTAGELLRNGKELMLHNVTLVIVSLREGAASGEKKPFHIDRDELSTQILVSRCLVKFIGMCTDNPEYWKDK